MDLLTWILQILILTLGIYLFLRFLRTTQGNRIVRGLAFAVPIVAIVIWGTAYSLQLEELRHILNGMTGFAVVFIAILFQEELRRGMAQFGENPLIRHFAPSTDTDVLEEICRAAIDLATKQETHGSFTRIRPYGALIVFERDNSLQSYIDSGHKVEARVSHELLETIFRPKSPLHDGAVIVRKDRIAAASCMLPLTQNLTVDKSTGTRHRAAIGLSEQTDAVVLSVSEETGRISIAAGGVMRPVPQGDLLNELRATLGTDPSAQKVAWSKRIKRFITDDIIWLGISVLLATMMLVISHQDIAIPRNFTVRLIDTENLTSSGPGDGEIEIRLPGAEWRLKEPSSTRSLSVVAKGSRSQLDLLGASLSGTFTLDRADELETTLEIDRIAWRKTPPLGMTLAWQEGDTPRIVIERYSETQLVLTPDLVKVDASKLNPHYELAKEGVDFSQNQITLTGPESEIEALALGNFNVELDPILLGPEDKADRSFPLRLPRQMTARGFSIAETQPVQIIVGIRPATTQISIEREVFLVGFAPTDRERLSAWSLPGNARTANFTILTSGLLPTDTGTPVWEETRRAILRYVGDNLIAYINIDDQPAGEAPRAVSILSFLEDPDWRKALGVDPSRERANLTIRSDNAPIYLTYNAPAAAGDQAPENGGE